MPRKSLRKERSLVDILQPNHVRVWYRLHTRGCRDLEPVSCPHEVTGEAPGWWEDDLWSAVAPEPTSACCVGGRSLYYPWLEWAQRSGIAPGQPFRVYVPEPKYSGVGEDFEEYWDYEIEQIVPWPRPVVARSWVRFWHKLNVRKELAAVGSAEALHIIYSNVSAMYLRQAAYDADHNTVGFPRGILLELHTRLSVPIKHLDAAASAGGYWCPLASARDDMGDFCTALQQLIEKACAKYPSLSPQLIKELPVRH